MSTMVQYHTILQRILVSEIILVIYFTLYNGTQETIFGLRFSGDPNIEHGATRLVTNHPGGCFSFLTCLFL
jgi:hypothetical protein